MYSLIIGALFLASTAASPVTVNDNGVGLSFAVRLERSGMKLPELDRVRAKHLAFHDKHHDSEEAEGLHRRSTTFSVTNIGQIYTANVSVGNPGTTYQLLIDTGSSNTWIGGDKPYTPTGSSKETGRSFTAGYGSGNVTGYEYTDRVALSDNLIIEKQSIGVANFTEGFNGFDGILGVGPVALTKDTVSGKDKIPTVVESLYKDGKIEKEIIGISYSPYSGSNTSNGILTFGGEDSGKYTGSITYASISKESPSKNFWGYEQSISYGGEQILSKTSGILDTGTTLINVATDAYQRYQSLTGATFDNATGMLQITNDQYKNLQSLYFKVGDSQFELTPNAQIWPRALNTFMGGNADSIYLVVSDIGHNSGEGLDFINGYSFLERFYSVYDTTNKRIGLATTENTHAESN